ncbi:hypothetical protein [Slackia heliotrinireducens]|uniref:Molecular chaperone Hsp90 n=1 Tax=Slackia heliotrinireducens (strain ATCC 29202 / DSM 20476 / NCTC 11029 / RHS 1) TaxID=471855 RepID=C7N8G1_SLAHD|nr:hypothetical protein [Slackia heliotrinireducens]ACV23196.1 hypothetical protein Shel_21860 [Slackia heliotrinireducens DSM 20476]VEH02283.1 Uncharacterised protein [Slackia heliotrinireducens]
MDKELFDFVAERADILSKSPASKQDTQEAAKAWLQAVPADASEDTFNEATEKLLDFLSGRMLGIDDLIAFVQGPGVAIFGEEGAAQMLAAQQERKAQGAKYCNCEAHTAAGELLAKFGRIEL